MWVVFADADANVATGFEGSHGRDALEICWRMTGNTLVRSSKNPFLTNTISDHEEARIDWAGSAHTTFCQCSSDLIGNSINDFANNSIKTMANLTNFTRRWTVDVLDRHYPYVYRCRIFLALKPQQFSNAQLWKPNPPDFKGSEPPNKSYEQRGTRLSSVLYTLRRRLSQDRAEYQISYSCAKADFAKKGRQGLAEIYLRIPKVKTSEVVFPWPRSLRGTVKFLCVRETPLVVVKIQLGKYFSVLLNRRVVH